MAIAEERTSITELASGPIAVDDGSASGQRTLANLGVAKLARAVAEIRAAEDVILSHLDTAQRLVRKLQVRGVHTDAGYSSPAEFESRVLAATSMIKALWLSNPTPPPAHIELVESKRNASEARTRNTKALATIAQSMDRMRSLEAEAHDAAVAARDTLANIDSQRLFEECGYASYEEFLERALAPSPSLSIALGCVAVESACPEPVTSVSVRAPVLPPVDEQQEVPALLLSHAPAVVPGLDLPVAGTAAPTAGMAPAPRSRISGIWLTLGVCAVATFAGALAGTWGNSGATASGPAHEKAEASMASTRSPESLAKTTASARPAPTVRTPGAEPSASAAAAARPHPSGPREAHRSY
ncbi:MAG: hypothetical protein ABSC94_17150 [Polyangiaceae bacterium]